MAKEDNKTAQKQKRHKEIGIIHFTIALFLMGVIFISAMQFFAPSIGNVFDPIGSCYSMSQNEFNEIKKAIHDLNAGKVPKSTLLTQILLTNGEAGVCHYLGQYYGSLAAEIECNGFCDDHTRNVLHLLRSAYGSALRNRKTIAKYYLWRAERLWKSP